MYKIYKHSITKTPIGVLKFGNENDSHCIPFDEDNLDYKEYLKWLEEGNTPEPADELPQE